MIRIGLVIISLAILIISSCSPPVPDDVALEYANLDEVIDFNSQVKPILSDKCFQCHGPDQAKQKAGLRLDLAEAAYAELKDSPGKFAIKPGQPNKSEVFHRIISDNPDYMMPTPESKLQLSAREKAILIKWIEQKAEYKPHWAFIKPEPIEPPEVNNEDWLINPIDRFVLKRIEQKGLEPSPQAEKDLLLRRLSLDLTGLPPTPEEIAKFLADDSEDAYEKQVDRLLASVHYGEKMTIDWMDLARYADTHGYQVDRYRNMSPWRDWVIKSFNENMPFDQFITWQLAGDLLDNPSREQILATGFNRLHPQNLEGGIVDEEFRVAYVSDRTDVLGQGLMGLTLSCAKCHDHKFDPVTQKDYYQLYTFFNNVNESGQISWEGATPVPTLLLPTEEQEAILDMLEGQASKQEQLVRQIVSKADSEFDRWIDRGGHQKIPIEPYPKELTAHFELENVRLSNRVNPAQTGKMDRRFSEGEKPVFAQGYQGNGILLDGDAWIDFREIGIFKRSQPFSIGLHVFIPKELETGVLFHKGMGARLHSFRGYHLYLKDNKLELMMAHTWPDNAIVEITPEDIPKDRWLQLTVTYDGSSRADGYKLFMDGKELATEIIVDNLYKDIVFNNMTDVIYRGEIEPGLQVGARWRGKGLGGAIVDNVIVYQRELSTLEVKLISDRKQAAALVNKSVTELTSDDRALLRGYFLNHHYQPYRKSLTKLKSARLEYTDSLEQVQEMMVMKEMPERRKAYVLERGLYDTYAEEVFPSTPSKILPMPEEMPRNRLGLAQWIVHPDHPLTARVAVNRYWQNYFGRGIVTTTEDFGNQGTLPTHPQLLDWLALEFINSGWDIKALQKLIVMSATYRQNSLASLQHKETDPDNIWLARGPTVRLTSEMIRDNALMASGLINKKIGGESVRPYQPEGLWKTNNDVYVQDTGDKLYRRSLYTIWKRTVPHPTLSTFDQPERSECTVRRQKTNTPLQALVLLNDPTYIEAARTMGETITAASDPTQAINQAFVGLTGRDPEISELELLLKLQKEQYQKFQDSPDKAKGWLELGQYRVKSDVEPNMVAANAVVASAIMNSDAAITKR